MCQLGSVSALNTVTAVYNRQLRKEAREDAKRKDLQRLDAELGPMFARVSFRRFFKFMNSFTLCALQVEGDRVHETLISCDEKGSPRGRGPTSGPGFIGGGAGTRKWRVAEVGRSGLPPFKLYPTLTRLEDFRLQGGERTGFGVSSMNSIN
jgi:hypothetical protein